MVRYVITEPNSDKAVWVGSAFFSKFIEAPARARGMLAAALAGDQATMENVYSIMRTEDSLIVTGVGHGNEDVFTGQYQRVIFERGGVPADVIAGHTITHMSCSTGARLLPWLVENGAIYSAGYRQDYWFMYNDASDPTQDVYAVDFMEPEMIKDAFALDGRTPSDAFEFMLTEYGARAKKWDSIDAEVADLIRYDMKIAVQFSPVEPPPNPPPEQPSWVCQIIKAISDFFKCG